jgi:hypothetical protein
VFIDIDSRKQWFHALRYENEDGLNCVVTGPVPDSAGGSSRHEDEEHIMCLFQLQMFVLPGLRNPVVCHGLVEEEHLNGKIGDTKSCFDKGMFEVHFEEASILPAESNMRIYVLYLSCHENERGMLMLMEVERQLIRRNSLNPCFVLQQPNY